MRNMDTFDDRGRCTSDNHPADAYSCLVCFDSGRLDDGQFCVACHTGRELFDAARDLGVKFGHSHSGDAPWLPDPAPLVEGHPVDIEGAGIDAMLTEHGRELLRRWVLGQEEA